MSRQHSQPVAGEADLAPGREVRPDRGLYGDYWQWKGWGDRFVCGPLDRERFRSDLAGIDLRGKRVLEIGFGQGAFLVWAREQGADVSGTELDSTSLDAAREAGFDIVSADFERTGELGAAEFDVIVAYDVFEHLSAEDLVAKLAAIDRALCPQGLLVMRYPNGQSPFGLPSQHGDATHVLALSEMKMRQFAAGTGLRTESYRGAAFVARPTLAHRLVVKLRNVVRRAMIRAIQFAMATDIPLEPVMVHTMRKY